MILIKPVNPTDKDDPLMLTYEVWVQNTLFARFTCGVGKSLEDVVMLAGDALKAARVEILKELKESTLKGFQQLQQVGERHGKS